MWQGPLAFLVKLADHARTHIFAPVVEFFLQLVFDELALLFNDQNLFQPGGEVAHTFRFQRPDHANLVQANAQFRSELIVDAEIIEGLAYIQVALSGSDDAQSRGR